jgi:AbrB family looped-hinge helix DNA binding protein
MANLLKEGRLTVPKAVRDAMRWAPRTRLIVESTPEGVLLRPKPKAKRPQRT